MWSEANQTESRRTSTPSNSDSPSNTIRRLTSCSTRPCWRNAVGGRQEWSLYSHVAPEDRGHYRLARWVNVGEQTSETATTDPWNRMGMCTTFGFLKGCEVTKKYWQTMKDTTATHLGIDKKPLLVWAVSDNAAISSGVGRGGGDIL